MNGSPPLRISRHRALGFRLDEVVVLGEHALVSIRTVPSLSAQHAVARASIRPSRSTTVRHVRQRRSSSGLEIHDIIAFARWLARAVEHRTSVFELPPSAPRGGLKVSGIADNLVVERIELGCSHVGEIGLPRAVREEYPDSARSMPVEASVAHADEGGVHSPPDIDEIGRG